MKLVQDIYRHVNIFIACLDEETEVDKRGFALNDKIMTVLKRTRLHS